MPAAKAATTNNTASQMGICIVVILLIYSNMSTIGHITFYFIPLPRCCQDKIKKGTPGGVPFSR